MNDTDDMMLKVSRAVQLRELCEGAALALPDDYKVVDVSIFRQRPMRRVERVELATFAEFVRYLKLRWRDGVSRCFVTENCVHGVIDFAEADGGAAWQNDEVMFCYELVRPDRFESLWKAELQKALAAEGVEVFLGKLSRSNASWFADSLER